MQGLTLTAIPALEKHTLMKIVDEGTNYGQLPDGKAGFVHP